MKCSVSLSVPLSMKKRYAILEIALPITVIAPIVPEGAAADAVDDDEEDKHHYIHNRHLSPVVLQVCKNPGLA